MIPWSNPAYRIRDKYYGIRRLSIEERERVAGLRSHYDTTVGPAVFEVSTATISVLVISRALSMASRFLPRVHEKIDKPTLQLAPSSVFPDIIQIFSPH